MSQKLILPLFCAAVISLVLGCDSTEGEPQTSSYSSSPHLIPPPPCEESMLNRSMGSCDDTGGGGSGTNPPPPPPPPPGSIIPSSAAQFWKDNPNEWPYDSAPPPLASPSYIDNAPRGQENTEWAGGLQGLAHDDQHWFISTREDIYKWNKSHGLPTSKPSSHLNLRLYNLPFPYGDDSYFNHFGDIDFVEESNNGLLYVPLEATHPDTDSPALVVLNDDLQLVSAYIIYDPLASHGNAMPWVSVHPMNTELVFTSSFGKWPTFRFDSGVEYHPVTQTSVYKVADPTRVRDYEYLGELSLKGYNCASPPSSGLLWRVQGGEFNGEGYLALAAEGGYYGAGIYFFDTYTGCLARHTPIGFNPDDQEIEGITIWDLNQFSPSTTGGMRGDIHSFIYKDGLGIFSERAIWLKHWNL